MASWQPNRRRMVAKFVASGIQTLNTGPMKWEVEAHEWCLLNFHQDDSQTDPLLGHRCDPTNIFYFDLAFSVLWPCRLMLLFVYSVHTREPYFMSGEQGAMSHKLRCNE